MLLKNEIWKLFLSLLILSLFSCSTSGVNYQQAKELIEKTTDSKARIFILRKNSFASGALSARVKLGNNYEIKISNGNYKFLDIEPGDCKLTIDNAWSVGDAIINASFETNLKYYYFIKPNESQTIANMFGILGSIFHYIFSSKNNDGSFEITSISEYEAMQMIENGEVLLQN